MKSFLITGSSGFIGSNLAHSLVNNKVELHLLVNKKSNLWRIKNILPDVILHKINISKKSEINSLIKKIEPDCTFHLASYGVHPFQKNFVSMFNTNVIGSFNLFESLEKHCESSKVVNIGSSFEYGPKQKSIKSSEILEPNTIYGVTKSSQSILANYFSQKTNLSLNTLRIFGAYGKYESKGRLIPDILLSVIKRKKLFISSPKSKRDFIHIDDVVSCILSASKKKINGEILNVGSGKEVSVEKIIEISRKILNKDIPVNINLKNQREFDKTGGGTGHANISETKKILGWEPKISFNIGIQESYDWFKENISFYD